MLLSLLSGFFRLAEQQQLVFFFFFILVAAASNFFSLFVASTAECKTEHFPFQQLAVVNRA